MLLVLHHCTLNLRQISRACLEIGGSDLANNWHKAIWRQVTRFRLISHLARVRTVISQESSRVLGSKVWKHARHIEIRISTLDWNLRRISKSSIFISHHASWMRFLIFPSCLLSLSWKLVFIRLGREEWKGIKHLRAKLLELWRILGLELIHRVLIRRTQETSVLGLVRELVLEITIWRLFLVFVSPRLILVEADNRLLVFDAFSFLCRLFVLWLLTVELP